MKEIEILKKIIACRLVFFDFDGVIKESVKLKGDAFETLFLSYGDIVVNRIRAHHNLHGGISRFEKIPLYMKWAGIDVTKENINEFLFNFSSIVKNKVVKSNWAPGVQRFIKRDLQNNDLYLITATPQLEIEEILEEIELREFFTEVIGSPLSKAKSIARIIKKQNINSHDAIMIGDSISDMEAAERNSIGFVLRKTIYNENLQKIPNLDIVETFVYE